MYQVYLKKGEERRILHGEPWIFANEVAKIEGEGKQGDACRVVAENGRFVCIGYINHASKIIVRVLSLKEEEIDRDFFFKRIKAAVDFRKSLGYENSYRAVFGENDLLPALIVDKYGDYLSCQFLSLGMDKRKNMIVDILKDIFAPKGIYERSDASVRKKEGLEEVSGLLYGEVPDLVKIRENELDIYVDIKGGQKTGYFLDQRENRDDLKYYVHGKRVLDCFCNAGGFSLCAAKYGANGVVAVDVSEGALELVRKNAALNGFNSIFTVKADVFEYLRECRKNEDHFDVIVLDPPAFTKSADKVKEGLAGYKDINIQALKMLSSGGTLVTCSCSQHVSETQFCDMINEALYESGKKARLVELRSQGKDHAFLAGTAEGRYLKVAVLSIV